MKKVFRFYWNCGRMGELEGIFIAEQSEVDDLIGKHVYFGEVLGKHSEIGGTIDPEDIEVLTDDQDFIAKAKQYGMSSLGYNPLFYLGNN